MKISGLSCITKKIFLVFLGHPTGEGSPLAGEDNRQKPLPKGRLSSTVIFVLKLCLFYILNLLLNKLSSRVLNLICETEANVKFKELSG